VPIVFYDVEFFFEGDGLELFGLHGAAGILLIGDGVRARFGFSSMRARMLLSALKIK